MILAFPAALAAGGLAVYLATLGDASVGAAIAGAFSILNSCLTAWLATRQRRTHQAVESTHALLKAPRRAVYDSDGRIVGTMLKLDVTGATFLPPMRADDLPDYPQERS